MIMLSVDHVPFTFHGASVSALYQQDFPLSRLLGQRRRAAEASAVGARAAVSQTSLDVELDALRAFFMLDERRRVSLWVGLVAVGGVAAETGTVMIVYLDEAIARRLKSGQLQTPADVDAAVIEGASQLVRPLLMTVATTVIGLLPLLWESGVGADVSARTAAPVVGDLWSCMLLTLLVLPAAYAMWRRYQLAHGRLLPAAEPHPSPS